MSCQILTRNGLRNLSVGVWSEKGRRERQEDVYRIVLDLSKDYRREYFQYSFVENPFVFFGVFDGHGGDKAALFTSRVLPAYLLKHYRQHADFLKALSLALSQVEREFIQTTLPDGSTALVVLITPNGRCLVANLGDCEGILAYVPLRMEDVHRRPLVRYLPLSSFEPHNLPRNEIERNRIQKLGATLFENRLVVSRNEESFTTLAVSRSIGDLVYKEFEPALIANPDLTEHTMIGFEDFIVLACDGLWDVLTQDQVFMEIRQCRNLNKTATEMAQFLVKLSLDLGSRDNITVIVLLFDNPI